MKFSVAILMGLFVSVNVLAYTVADGWTIRQITNSEYIPLENEVKISGNNIIWKEFVDAESEQIMFCNGTTVSQISSGTNSKDSPQISGSNVVWEEYVGDKDQIMFWNGTAATRISSGTNFCDSPKISGSNVVWLEDTGNGQQIMFWNGTTVTLISSGTNSKDSPQISGSNVVWLEDTGNGQQIMFWNGTTVTLISNGTNSKDSPQISGSNVVWREYTSSGSQIMFWNGTTPTQISSGANNKQSPHISGSKVVWNESIGNHFRVMLWNGTSINRLRVLVSSDIHGIFISGSNVCWAEEMDEVDILSLYYSDGNLVSKIAEPHFCGWADSPYAISGTSIAICAYDEDYNAQIYLLQPGESTPPTISLAGDINKDNRVDLGDLSIVASQWLQVSKERIQKFSLDTNPTWSTTGQWAYGKPMGLGGTVKGYPDPIKGYSGLNVYGVNLNGDYAVSAGSPRYLTTGAIDCGDYENVELRFARWLNSDNANYVKCTVEVSNDQSNWHIVWTNSAQTAHTENEWQTVSYDISQVADGQQTVYVRWGYQIVDERAFAYSGWNIDDVEFWGR